MGKNTIEVIGYSNRNYVFSVFRYVFKNNLFRIQLCTELEFTKEKRVPISIFLCLYVPCLCQAQSYPNELVLAVARPVTFSRALKQGPQETLSCPTW